MSLPLPSGGATSTVALDEPHPSAPHGGFGRSVLSVMRGTILGQAVTVVATPIVSRLFTPAVFGEFALVVSVAATMSALAGFRYETAIPLAADNDEAEATFAVAIVGVVIVAMLSLVLLPSMPRLLHDLPSLREWRFAIPALVLLTGSGQALSNMAIRNRQFDELSWFKVNQTLPVAVLQICLGLLVSRGPASLMLAAILGQLAACLLLGGAVARARMLHSRHGVTIAGMQAAMSRFRNFPMFMTPYGLVSVGRERAIYVLLGLYSSTTVVGIYALAYRLTLLPISLITASLSPVMFQRASATNDIREVEGLIRTLLTWLVRMSVPAVVLVAVAAQRFAGALLGSSWQSVGTYAAVLALPAWLMLHTTWLDRMLDRLSRQKLALGIEVTYSIIALTTVTVLLRWSHSGLVGIAAFAAITSVYNVVWLVALYRVARFRLVTLGALGRDAAVIAGASFGVIWLLVVVLPALAAVIAGFIILVAYEVLCLRAARSRVGL